MFEASNGEVRTEVVPLITGLVEDIQTLVRQELALVKGEAREQVSKLKYLGFAVLAGLLLSGVGSILLLFGLAQLIVVSFPNLQPWQGLGLVGSLVFVVGLGVLLRVAGAISSWGEK